MSDGPLKIVAYVCEGGVIHETGDEGYSSFGDLFRRNPDGCRYAVAITPQGEHRVYDMFDCLMQASGTALPGKYSVLPTLDAAMTAAVMLPPIGFISDRYIPTTTYEDNTMFAATNFSRTSVEDYASAKAYLERQKPWRGETDPTDERPLAHRRARTMGVRIDHQDIIRFRLHSTDVVIYYPDGTIRMNVYASVTTDAFANVLLPRGVYTSFNGGYVRIDDLIYRAVDNVVIRPDGKVEPQEQWSRYVVDRKAANAARKAHPEIAQARAWLKARDALTYGKAVHATGPSFPRWDNIDRQLEFLKDRANWAYVTLDDLGKMDHMLIQTRALVATDPVDAILSSELGRYQAARRKWGTPR